MDSFASRPEACFPLLKGFRRSYHRKCPHAQKPIDFWKNCSRLVIAGVPAMIGETRESVRLEEFRRLDEHPPAIVISLDRSGEGWRLYRYESTPVDFTLISNCPEIEFAHKSGFMAKTRERLPMDELIALVSQAVTVVSAVHWNLSQNGYKQQLYACQSSNAGGTGVRAYAFREIQKSSPL